MCRSLRNLTTSRSPFIDGRSQFVNLFASVSLMLCMIHLRMIMLLREGGADIGPTDRAKTPSAFAVKSRVKYTKFTTRRGAIAPPKGRADRLRLQGSV